MERFIHTEQWQVDTTTSFDTSDHTAPFGGGRSEREGEHKQTGPAHPLDDLIKNGGFQVYPEASELYDQTLKGPTGSSSIAPSENLPEQGNL